MVQVSTRPSLRRELPESYLAAKYRGRLGAVIPKSATTARGEVELDSTQCLARLMTNRPSQITCRSALEKHTSRQLAALED